MTTGPGYDGTCLSSRRVPSVTVRESEEGLCGCMWGVCGGRGTMEAASSNDTSHVRRPLRPLSDFLMPSFLASTDRPNLPPSPLFPPHPHIQAYDQHLNMILGEVEETVTSTEIDEETDEEIVKKQTRKVGMLFVRGDIVVLVSPPLRTG